MTDVPGAGSGRASSATRHKLVIVSEERVRFPRRPGRGSDAGAARERV